MNLWVADGVVSKEPEKRQAGNSTVTKLSMCVSEVWQDKKTGKSGERKLYMDVKLWGNLGDAMYEQVQQGDRVLVRGKLETESWDNKTTGKKEYRTVCNCEQISILTVRVPTASAAEPENLYETGGDGNPPF